VRDLGTPRVEKSALVPELEVAIYIGGFTPIASPPS
jgi:hypothetical protein